MSDFSFHGNEKVSAILLLRGTGFCFDVFGKFCNLKQSKK